MEVLFATHKQLHIQPAVVVLNMVIVVELLLTVELDVRAVVMEELVRLVHLHLLHLNLLHHLLVAMVVVVTPLPTPFAIQTVRSEHVVQLPAGADRPMPTVYLQMVVKAVAKVL